MASILEEELELLSALFFQEGELEVTRALDGAASVVVVRLEAPEGAQRLHLTARLPASYPAVPAQPALARVRMAADERELLAQLGRIASAAAASRSGCLLELVDACRDALQAAPPCSICLDTGAGDAVQLSASCSHVFHVSCVREHVYAAVEQARRAEPALAQRRLAQQLLAQRSGELRQAQTALAALRTRSSPLEAQVAALAQRVEDSRAASAAVAAAQALGGDPPAGSKSGGGKARLRADVAEREAALLVPLPELTRQLSQLSSELKRLHRDEEAARARVSRCDAAAQAASVAAAAAGVRAEYATESQVVLHVDGSQSLSEEDAAAAALAAVALQAKREAADAEADFEAHLSACRHALPGTLVCPTCRVDISFASDLEARYVPWLRIEHRSRAETRAREPVAAAPEAPRESAAKLLARTGTVEGLDLNDATRTYLQRFTAKWADGFAKQVARGGIIGASDSSDASVAPSAALPPAAPASPSTAATPGFAIPVFSLVPALQPPPAPLASGARGARGGQRTGDGGSGSGGRGGGSRSAGGAGGGGGGVDGSGGGSGSVNGSGGGNGGGSGGSGSGGVSVSGSGGRGGRSGSGRSGGGGGACFKCGQLGHFSRDCKVGAPT